jgi:two-component system KDP operon response regulator KdpE
VVAGDPPSDVSAVEPADIVIVDLEPFDPEIALRVKRAYPGAEILAICGAYREADCIAILERNIDYLPRPFLAQDLVARVRVAELRRLRTSGRGRFYRRGSVVIDLIAHRVDVDGTRVTLARAELNILMRLASRRGQVATFGEILAGLGRADTPRARRGLNMAIFRLRRRIECNPSRPDLVLTEPGVGYRLAPEPNFGWLPGAAETERRDVGSFPH